MIMWCDHCLLVALWFRFHIELAKCLLFGAAFSDLISKCERQKTSQNTTREKRCSPPKSSISSRSCLGSLEQHLFFRIALRHDCYVLPLALTLCRHSAQGMAKDLACWPTVLSGCMSACENVCDIRANGAYAYQCWDSFLGAISAPYTSFVSCAFFYHHIVLLLILEYNN